MFRLVESDLIAARELDAGDEAPAAVGDGGGEFHSLFFEFFFGSADIAAHEVELVVALFIRMHGDFGWWEGEDEPSVAGVDGGELEDIAKEFPQAVGLFGVNNGVDAGDHLRFSYEHEDQFGIAELRVIPASCFCFSKRRKVIVCLQAVADLVKKLPVRVPVHPVMAPAGSF